ncbi:alpha/beta fold hydrolase [Veronia pacifica]|uniref:Serine aminopeptidase S33 domain-containing protein n=1 Tax=Veronia pacifica TaxID=1080227 RepID=A0A1C3EID2_9GAMM|nr:alpha/beta hydrolase [Veronia pacifica]ODA33006.1 hypothetical protein A8L45_11990 [Veronia pacifica]
MSSKIYFKNNKQRFDFSKLVINLVSRTCFAIVPKITVKYARKLFLTPARNQSKNEEPTDLKVKDIQGDTGKIRVYQSGEGPVWLMVHGWSGSASQFFPLMQKVTAMGYTAVAFDQPAHGQSEGQEAHIPNMISALESVITQYDEIEGIIAHSMGVSISLHIIEQSLKGKPCLFIAPALFYWENAIKTVQRSGVDLQLYNAVIEQVSSEFEFAPEDFDPDQKLFELSSPVTIVHDKEDRFTPFEASRKASDCDHIELVETENLGHGRILKSEEVERAFTLLATRDQEQEIA